MISLNTKKLLDLNNEFLGFTLNQLEEYKTLANKYYRKSQISQEQGFVDLPDKIEIIDEIKEKTERFIDDKYTDIIVLGIGGSMLGVQTIVDTLYTGKSKKVHCIDNIDPFLINSVLEIVNLKNTIILVQTKSGNTPETLAQFFYFKERLEEARLDLSNHFIFVTDAEKGYLRSLAEENEQITTFEIPENVGGRFSVLTPVGLVIASLLNINTKELLLGAKTTLNEQKGEAMQIAKIQTELLKEGININVMMPYSSRLATMCKWYIQLLSESIGKEFNLNGDTVNTGITPVPAVGATDQHSQLQLFKEGPNDKLLIFLEVLEHQDDKLITSNELPDKFKFLEGVTFGQLLNAELEATAQSLNESDKPNFTITLPKVNEFYIGSLFMLLELSVAYIGELFGINAFDQPGVERGKILTKKILEKSKESLKN